MKILAANAGPLTNFEVLEFLRSKGAAKDPTRVLAKVVYDFLDQNPAHNQTREAIINFVDQSNKYDLAKAEILNIINLRPITPVEIFPARKKPRFSFPKALLPSPHRARAEQHMRSSLNY